MAKPTETKNLNTEAIAQHLQKGAFAPIFEQSTEKDDPVALKLMCVIDYHVLQGNLYTRMQAASPKLLTHLLHFRSYGSFKYYDYMVGKGIGKRVLKCKWCELVGPYGLILTHLAINHDTHIGLKLCSYCNSTELRKHLDPNTNGQLSIEDCYANYLQRHDIEVDETVLDIVTDFYDILKSLSDKLKVTTLRSHSFRGIGYGTAQRLERSYGSDIDTNVMVFKNRAADGEKKIVSGHLAELNGQFRRVIRNLYGSENASRFTRQQQKRQSKNTDGGEAIIISSDDDDGGDSDRSAATVAYTYTSNRTFKMENTSGEGTSTGTDANGADGMDLMPPPFMHMKSEPLANDFTTPTTATINASRKTTSPMVQIPMPLANVPSPNVPLQIKTMADSDPFLQFIAQRLDQATDASERRELENTILGALVTAKKNNPI